MALVFHKIARLGFTPDQNHNVAYLKPDNWDDFGHKTLFTLIIFDEQGREQIIGSIKIGFVGKTIGWTEENIPPQFESLPNHFFSLGQDADFYRKLIESFSLDIVVNVLTALGDVAHDPSRFKLAENESSFSSSLLRTVDRASVEHQFRRILRNEAPLTPYRFFYEKPANNRYSGIEVEFTVKPNTKPSTNIHILIGRNGVGKTTLLNNMVKALVHERAALEETGVFSTRCEIGGYAALNNDYFAGVVSISFSAFDKFIPPDDQTDANAGMRYYYVGLKKRIVQTNQIIWGLKDKEDLCRDFTNSLKVCFALTAKKDRWLCAIRKLESDFNFAEMNLHQLIDIYSDDLTDNKSIFTGISIDLFERMSSGHAIVILTLTKLVETVEEKTLVLLDEPESHLHPPLLSAFTRALSDLLVNRNGVAILATHSPVVLQEVPKSCVSILRRTRLIGNVDRPEQETFGENVGVLTREVFGLEVSRSGFHGLLKESVETDKSYENIVLDYENQLGSEATSLLRGMVMRRDRVRGQT